MRVEQEFADLVDEYNKLVKQDRWTEAELIAKQAKELDKENPVAETMFVKARLGRENARIADLKIRKEDNFLNQLWEVEDAAATPMYGSPYKFPKDWSALTKRRKGKYDSPDNKQRTEPEKQIEELGPPGVAALREDAAGRGHPPHSEDCRRQHRAR